MAKFVLTAQLQLQAPKNAAQVANNIQNQLKSVSIPVTVKGAAQATKQINQITTATHQASSAADAMGRSFGLALKRFAAFTVASRAVSLFTNSLANAIDESIEFQRELVKISQVTGKSVAQLRDLQNTINRLSTGLGVSSKDLLATSRILAQTGLEANDLKVALDALAKTTLAPTFDDITQTAEGAVAILAQFGEGVGALERQLGAINAVAGQFAVESGDLISAVRRFGGVFQAAGGSLEELLAVFTSVRATTRESAESISTGLRTIFTRIQRPKTIEYLKQFGVELLDVEGKFVGPFEAAKRLSQALAGLEQGDIRFIEIAEELGGFRQIGKVIPLLQQFTVAEKARQAALRGGDSLSKDAASAQQALAVQITKVKEEFYALVRAITETASFQAFAKTALNIASALISIANAIKPLIPLLGALAAFKFAQGFGSFLAGAGAAIRGFGKNQGGQIHAFARGGFVPGSGNRDTVPAMLTPGEFVIRKSSASKLGAGTLHAMNQNRFAGGAQITAAMRKPASGPKQERKGFGSPTKQNPVRFYPTPGKIGLFALNPSNQPAQLKDSKDKDFKLTNPTLRQLVDPNSKGKETPARLLGSQYSAIYPQVSENGATPTLESFIKPKIALGLSDLIGNVATTLASSQFLKFEPAIRLNKKLLKSAKSDIQSDEGAINTTAGYIWEGLITALSGASASGGGANFDFPTQSIRSNRKKLAGLFGSSQIIANLAKADAKPSDNTKYFSASTPSGSLPAKTINDINQSNNLSGVQMLKKSQRGTEGIQRKMASGGSVGTDTVPALLTPGEFVVNKKAAQNIGYGNLRSMNKSGVARFAKGGTVGSIFGAIAQRYELGDKVTAEDAKKVIAADLGGALINTAEDFAKAIMTALGPVPAELRAEIEAALQSTSGVTDKSLGSSGRAKGVIGTGVDASGRNTYDIQVARGVGSEGTAVHEIGHAVDYAAGQKITGKAKTAASETEGTFQNAISNKIAPHMQKAMEEAGASADWVANYAGKNKEIFANFYSQANSNIQTILASTGDSELAMIDLANELSANGDTFAGLSANDLIPEITAIYEAAKATRKAMEEQRDAQQKQLAGMNKSISDKEATGAALNQVKATKQASIEQKEAALVGMSSVEDVTTSVDLAGGSKNLNRAQIEAGYQNAQDRKRALANAPASPQKLANLDAVDKELAVYREALARNTQMQNEQQSRLDSLNQEIEEEKKSLDAVQVQLDRNEDKLKKANEHREALNKQMQETERTLREAGIKENRAGTQLGLRDPSPADRRRTAGDTGVDPMPKRTSPDAGPASPKTPTAAEKTAKNTNLVALFAGMTAVTGALQTLRPNIDENSGAFAKMADSLIGGLQKMVAIVGVVVAALSAFGIQLNKQTLGNIGSFLGGGGSKGLRTGNLGDKLLGGSRSRSRVQNLFTSGGKGPIGDAITGQFKSVGKNILSFGNNLKKSGGMLSKFGPSIAKFGAGIAKAGPAAAGIAGGLATLAAGAAVAGGAMYALNSIIDSYSGVHEKAKKAIENGEVATAGEAAVKSANTKVTNKLTVGLASAGGALIAFGGPVGWVAGTLLILGSIALKVADMFGLLEGPINWFRDNIGVVFGGDSTNTIKAQARLEAAKNKVTLEAAAAARRSAAAMARVESGASSLAEEFAKGNLTQQLENEFGVLQETTNLTNSKLSDTDKTLGGMIESGQVATGDVAAMGAAIGMVLGPVGALAGGLIGWAYAAKAGKDAELKRAEALKASREAQEKFTESFIQNLGMFSNVVAEGILKGQSEEQARAALMTTTDANGNQVESVFAKGIKSQFSPQQQARIEQLRQRQAAGGELKESEKELIKIRDLEIERQKSAEEAIAAAIKQAKRQLELIKAINFGLGALSDQLDATVGRMNKLLTIDEVGDKFQDSLGTLQTALTAAASSLTKTELDSAINTLGDTLRESGASESSISKVQGQARGFATAFARLNKENPAFKNIQEELKRNPGMSTDKIKQVVGDQLTAGLPAEVADRIKKGIDTQEFSGEDLARIAAGDFGPLKEALQATSDAFNKDILGVLEKRSQAEQALIKGIQNRIKAEEEYIAAQRRAIELQLEAAKAFEDFGGAKLTREQKQDARLASFNVGAQSVGVRGLQSGSAQDIQATAADISNQFLDLEAGARAGALAGERRFSGGAGAEEDKRERLKTLQQDLIAATQKEIQARKEELDIIKKKNEAEKSALDKLISGDIEGFLSGQAAAGAGAALASGSTALTGLFDAASLGAGFKTLDGQGLSDQQMRKAEDLTLARFGVTSTGVMSGTTAEEQAIKAEGRDLAATLGSLGQQAAEFERAELSTKEAIVYAQRVELGNLGKELDRAMSGPQGQAGAMARGGMVYASRGIFVPRGTDTVPAMLTPGEFVVNRAAVSRGNNLQILRAMNSGGGASAPGAMSGGGRVQYYNFGGMVDGIASAFSGALPQLTSIFGDFATTVEKLVNTKFNVALDPTNINVNFNGTSFLSTLKEDIMKDVIDQVGSEIQKYKVNNTGDLAKQPGR